MNYKKTIELRFPSSIYYADPYAAIRSILGNDVEIISFNESSIILPDANVLINVEYSSIDFDLFRLYSIEETKTISQQSQKIVATKLRDTITNELLPEDKIVVILKDNKSTASPKIFINYLDQIGNKNEIKNIKYYGFIPQSKSDVLHSYCSVIDTEFLSYHGTSIKHTPTFEKSDKLGQTLPLNVDLENKAIQKLSIGYGIEVNNFTNSNIDLSILLNFGVVLDSQTELSNLKLQEIKLDDVSKKSGIINLSGLKIDDIRKALLNQKGIILISKYRDNISSIVYFKCNSNIIITNNCIENMLLVLDYDNYNLNLMNFK